MAAYDEVVIISGCRTPVGKFQGSLSDLSATQLGAIVVREAVKRAHLDPNAHNGAVFLGLNGIVVKSHGGASVRGIANAIGVAHDLIVDNVRERIADDLANFRAHRPEFTAATAQ